MNTDADPITILIADDDDEDCILVQEALIESRLANRVVFVHDGQELLEYLRREGRYAAAEDAPLPGLILLDLNMPGVDGRSALREIRQDPALRHLPVVMLTSSDCDDDIRESYCSGVNSYITKPVTFASLVDAMKGLGHYWFEIVKLPTACGPTRPAGCRPD